MNTLNRTINGAKMIELTFKESYATIGSACSCTCSGYGNRLTIKENIGNYTNNNECKKSCKEKKYYFSFCETILRRSASTV